MTSFLASGKLSIGDPFLLYDSFEILSMTFCVLDCAAAVARLPQEHRYLLCPRHLGYAHKALGERELREMVGSL
jgi:hypothetical protein